MSSVQGGLCPGRGGLCPGRGVSVQGGLCRETHESQKRAVRMLLECILVGIISFFDLNKVNILPPWIQINFTLTWSSSLSSRLDGLISLWIIFW